MENKTKKKILSFIAIFEGLVNIYLAVKSNNQYLLLSIAGAWMILGIYINPKTNKFIENNIKKYL